MLKPLRQDGVLTHRGRDIRWSFSFEGDLERIYTDELRIRRHHPKPGTLVSKLGWKFHQLTRGRLEHLQGKVLRVEFAAELAPHRELEAVAEIARRAAAGEPLWPYLSSNTRKPDFKDDLAAHWGVVHFHLGVGFRKDGFANRSGDHLYALIQEETIYFLDIRNHAFADERVLNVVVRNWPELMEPFEIQGGLSKTSAKVPEITNNERMRRYTRTMLVQAAPSMSPGDTTALREAGVTPTFESETGAHYAPLGGGVSLARTGMHARVRADYEMWWADQLAKALVDELRQVVEHIERERETEFDTLEFRIESLEALRAARVRECNSKVDLNFPLNFDHDLDPARILAPLVAATAKPR